MTTKIRLATVVDLATIREIFNHALINTTAIYSYKPYTHAKMRQWFDDKKAHDFPVYVSTNGNQVTGLVTYGSFRSRRAYKYTAEHAIYVHPDYRRQGIAKLLMTHIINIATQANLHVLMGVIDSENQLSIDFHKTFGFIETGQLKQVAFKFDRWLDATFMQLILATPETPIEG